MEFHQSIQNRTTQTVAVINTFAAGLSVAGVDAAGLAAQGLALDPMAQQRDHALADYDGANNAERRGLLALQHLVLTLPKVVEAELDDHVHEESALIDLLAPAYAIKPRTTEAALSRGHKLASALERINAYLAAMQPPRAGIVNDAQGLVELNAAMEAQTVLAQTLANGSARLNHARVDLREAAVALDRLNKRFYARMQALARANPALARAMTQIDTGAPNLPATLSIKDVVQGGEDHLHVLVAYDPASVDGKADSTLEWQIAGVDADFSRTVRVDPSGNAIGPFSAGQLVKLRTRVRNGNGSATSAVRNLGIV
jgi:hypothetical protein